MSEKHIIVTLAVSIQCSRAELHHAELNCCMHIKPLQKNLPLTCVASTMWLALSRGL